MRKDTTVERDPQVVIPRWLHEALKSRSRKTGVKVKVLAAEALETGMRTKRWIASQQEAAA